jgi:hypothetical protein
MKKDHSDKTFSDVLISILDSFSIRDRILAVTTDNASNNNIFMRILNKELRKSVTEIFNINSILHIPYLAYVIQLAAKIIIGRLKIESKNNSIKINWEKNKTAEEIKKTTEIAKTLTKIYHDQCKDLIILTKISY